MAATKRASRAEAEAIEFGRLADYLGYHLRRAQLASFERFASAVTPLDLSPAEFSVMLLIEANPGIKQTSLARALGVERSTMVRLVDRLAGIDIVKRGMSSTDRRSAPPELTPTGHATIARVAPAVHHGETLLSEALTATERTTLLRLLRKLNRIES